MSGAASYRFDLPHGVTVTMQVSRQAMDCMWSPDRPGNLGLTREQLAEVFAEYRSFRNASLQHYARNNGLRMVVQPLPCGLDAIMFADDKAVN